MAIRMDFSTWQPNPLLTLRVYKPGAFIVLIESELPFSQTLEPAPRTIRIAVGFIQVNVSSEAEIVTTGAASLNPSQLSSMPPLQSSEAPGLIFLF